MFKVYQTVNHTSIMFTTNFPQYTLNKLRAWAADNFRTLDTAFLLIVLKNNKPK